MTVGGLLALIAVAIVIVTTRGGTAGHGTASSARKHSLRAGTLIRYRRRRLSREELIGNRTARRLAKLGLPLYCGGHHGDEVAFTFDDGPGPYTGIALRKLRHAGERATFFVVGRNIDRFPGDLGAELRDAAIGDHTYTHPELTALPPAMVFSEIERTAARIERVSGDRVDLFRPPYELHNATVDSIAKRLGLLETLWNVDSADSLGANYTKITTNVKAGLRPGSIILMHENRGQTIRALAAILPALHRRHLRSVSVPELLASDPPTIAQLRAGRAGCAFAARVRAGTGG
jgi:peptidoglycan/xylan/chitin deacetylase (PgdA/CDA1 family)